MGRYVSFFVLIFLIPIKEVWASPTPNIIEPNRISVERNRYNETVKEFNSKIRKFPTSMVARLMGVEKRDYFEAQSGSDQAPNDE